MIQGHLDKKATAASLACQVLLGRTATQDWMDQEDQKEIQVNQVQKGRQARGDGRAQWARGENLDLLV